MNHFKEPLMIIAVITSTWACAWFVSESAKTMTLVCVKVIGERDGLQKALEVCSGR